MRHLLIVLSLLMAGCGSKPPRLEPPGIKLVDLRFTPDQADFELRVRLSNPVPRAMPIGRVQFKVSVDEKELGQFEPAFTGELASLGEEVLTVTGDGSAAVLSALARLNSGDVSRLPLEITGQVVDDAGREYKLRREGWLSATPGRPWSYR